MKTFKKLAIAAGVALAPLALTPANAAVALFTTADAGGDGILNAPDQFQILNARVDPLGELNSETNEVSFQVGSRVDSVFLDFGVIQAQPDRDEALARGIENFILTVTGNLGTNVSFQITDDTGTLLLTSLQSFAVSGNEMLTFMFTGTAFGGPGTRPSYDVGVFGNEAIPLPGAAVFFLTAAAAGGGLRLRRKRA
ncbi:hypothetical protein [Parvularcula oceani]|uniref:hypothetical protein n=1 Tax=Parvularcula oceani TaxID=1247963 RepID=UPI0004E16972|nr:hypothetical protein [Parvularcula oceani]